MRLIKFPENKIFRTVDTLPTLFNEFFSDYFNGEKIADNGFKSLPAVNIHETAEHFRIDMAVPGMKKSDFKIGVEKGLLTIWSS